jgi:CRISPR-associated Csx2 family protein
MAKVFISFLGANRYFPSKYYYSKDKSDLSPDNVFYVQEDLIRIFCKDWKQEDRFIVFTTPLAAENNWSNRITFFNRETKETKLEEGKGLEYRISEINPNLTIYNKPISNGANEDETWEIFSKIVEEIKLDNEVYLDITYSFRFIPALSTVLLNYVKTVKNATVEKVVYGNYEVGKTQNNESPIVELSNFDTLQKWTNAAQSFNQFGVSDELVKLFKKHESLANLSQQLSDLTTAIYTCRGLDLNTSIDINSLKVTLENQKVSENFIAQFNPLIELIENKIKDFQHQTVLNGLNATDWCITHNLIPQGYTFLQETLKSYIVEKVFDLDFLNDYDYRQLAHLALNGALSSDLIRKLNSSNRKRANKDSIPDRTRDLIRFTDDITNTYQQLTGTQGSRNDISHCGYNSNPRTGEELREDLKALMIEIKQLNLM